MLIGFVFITDTTTNALFYKLSQTYLIINFVSDRLIGRINRKLLTICRVR